MEVVHKNDSFLNEIPPPVEDQNLYEVLEKLPQPRKMFELSDDQKKIWYWYGYQFLHTKQLTEGDLTHLQRAAFWLDTRNKMMAQVNKKNREDPNGIAGWVQTFKNGVQQSTPFANIIKDADKALNEISNHFGLSFADRKKIKSPDASGGAQLDIFGAFAARLNS